MKMMGRSTGRFSASVPWTRAARATAACWKNSAPTIRRLRTPTPASCLNHERIKYWLSVGAQPSEKVRVFLKKYGVNGTHLAQQQAARERLALPRSCRRRPSRCTSAAEVEQAAASGRAAAEAAEHRPNNRPNRRLPSSSLALEQATRAP